MNAAPALKMCKNATDDWDVNLL